MGCGDGHAWEGMEADDLLCSRNARLRRPSPGIVARLGVPVGERVRKLRVVEVQSAPIPEEITSKLGGSYFMEMCSFEGRSQA